MMKAAKLYQVASDMKLDMIPMPTLPADEVLVKVAACNVVQNLKNVLKGMGDAPDKFPFPALLAVFGLDATGTVEECGPLVQGFKVGDRVYVNPGLSCRGCEACRSGRTIDCEAFALRGVLRYRPRQSDDVGCAPARRFCSVHGSASAQSGCAP